MQSSYYQYSQTTFSSSFQQSPPAVHTLPQNANYIQNFAFERPLYTEDGVWVFWGWIITFVHQSTLIGEAVLKPISTKDNFFLGCLEGVIQFLVIILRPRYLPKQGSKGDGIKKTIETFSCLKHICTWYLEFKFYGNTFFFYIFVLCNKTFKILSWNFRVLPKKYNFIYSVMLTDTKSSKK